LYRVNCLSTEALIFGSSESVIRDEMDSNGQSGLSHHIYNVIWEIHVIRKITKQVLQANGASNELLPGRLLNTSGMIWKERERSVYFTTLSIVKLASIIAERNTSM
jgi:hypothetical protein